MEMYWKDLYKTHLHFSTPYRTQVYGKIPMQVYT